MSINLPDLPYPSSALAPHVSERTLDYHYGKHHAGYVTKLNAAIAGTEFENADLAAIVKVTDGDDALAGIFNNAAQAWNHAFLWRSMSPAGGGPPAGDIAALIDAGFGGYDAFAEAFKTQAMARFGSGWAWLVHGPDGLALETSANADTPLAGPRAPLLTLDLWEHAYYLDYQNERGAYVDVFLEKLINWEFAAANLAAATAARRPAGADA